MPEAKSVEALLSDILKALPDERQFEEEAVKIRWVIGKLEERLVALGKMSTGRPPPRA